MIPGSTFINHDPTLVWNVKSSRKTVTNMRFYICVHIYSWAFTVVSAWVCKHIYILQVSIYLFWMQIQLQQSFSEAQLLGNHCLLCNLARLLDGVFDSTVYLLDFMRTRPSIVTNHLASKCDDAGGKIHCQAFPLRLIITFWSSGVCEH